jgi:hypothetical protein
MVLGGHRQVVLVCPAATKLETQDEANAAKDNADHHQRHRSSDQHPSLRPIAAAPAAEAADQAWWPAADGFVVEPAAQLFR